MTDKTIQLLADLVNSLKPEYRGADSIQMESMTETFINDAVYENQLKLYYQA